MKKLIAILMLFFSHIAYSAGLQGLTYEVYDGGGPSPNISNRQLLSTGVVSNINFDWGGGYVLDSGRYDNVIIRFYGYYKVPGTGVQTVYLGITSDDGQILTINNNTIVNCWYGAINANGGDILPIEIWYYENGGGAMVQLWQYNFNYGWEIVPANTLGTTYSYFDPTVTITGSSSGITNTQQSELDGIKLRQNSISLGNKIYLEVKLGSSNSNVSIEQSGNYNLIQGLGGGNAIIDGDYNTFNIKQGSIGGKNLIEFSIVGNSNSTTIWQSRNSNGALAAPESGGHYAGISLAGNNNTISIKQSNDGNGNSGHYSLVTLAGSNNGITIRQSNDNEKKLFGTITGNSNNANIIQEGLGNQYLDLSLSGNGHITNITQKDNGTHRATINLQNFGGASSLNLIQQGNANQSYSILQQCANLNGCSVSVTQGNGQ
jgi:hypothetical protein